MKNTLSLWTAVMVLVCVSLQVSALPYSDTRVLQDNRLLSLKRTKPSLSIVNPLDVLRQRIILEMARRQMRENTRQVELNKALLREIGKRSSNMYDGGEYPPNYSSYDRKAYSQRIAADPVRGRTQATDELDAMVEAFMRYNQLAAQDRKPHRAHIANDRSSLSGNENGILTGQPQPDAEPSQRQTLHGHFNNEQDDLKTKEQALRQSLAAGQEQQDSTDENGVNEEQDEEPVSGSNGALETNQQTPNERTTGGEFGPRYVYGMYKSRYAN